MRHLIEVERVEIICLVDNYTDGLLYDNTDVIRRYWTDSQKGFSAILLAEHGLSMLVKVYRGGDEHVCLLDAGLTDFCLFHNAEALGVDLEKCESVVLSHGHRDHFGGLSKLFEITRGKKLLVLHPEAFLERRLNNPAEKAMRIMPQLDEKKLLASGADLKKSKLPYYLASGTILATGAVKRTTDFEKGFPHAEAKIDGDWRIDPVQDDQCLVVKLKDKGLIVIGGCSHAGIINTIHYAQEITGTKAVHAIFGGFHLTGAIFEPIIDRTIEEMKRINPKYVIPMHCTGQKAICRFSQEMPGAFIQNVVGTTYRFQ
ncbi:MAG: MBL fold metallo-hydrolase [Deltaproteobacteria bacterium]|jgi:7,8-dihydropterin-6-yl-methyl-4-(beta-D-ribofuranosyl)aminobenzene 5'-phosphate synthase